ncbi:hypothetical protein EOD41_02980 [Mucilaginibacter limnophilus]|uniref:Uncharacterized protein n=1 Tax=Mucilaginibacter limnophilus TaxID=1932778 RepID=A0A3S3TK68_9SPHI|nr:hypothetical protein [Mucilaginibacter limnophilus]RVU02918.1 hypothetical protein EOD41_02980 [Mucilaginibacter limnophilus]
MDALTDNILLNGTNTIAAKPLLLKAGKLTMQYQNGNLRYIKAADVEVIRMIYAAVRDENWGTVEPVVLAENIIQKDTSFSINLKVEYKALPIHYVADYAITGLECGKIIFDMKGTCVTPFRKNRIGFCILHPLATCEGKTCEITHADGNTVKYHFPKLVSPAQPFLNVAGMEWTPANNITAILKFSGDIFETEDQRNWTDASYKTYCTPLALPYPVWVSPGDVFKQQIELTVTGDFTDIDIDKTKHFIQINKNKKYLLPEIGVAAGPALDQLTNEELSLLKNLRFKHYRIDVKVGSTGWREKLISQAQEAVLLQLPLFIALHVNLQFAIEDIDALYNDVKSAGAEVNQVLLFQTGRKTTDNELLHRILPVIRERFPLVNIGAGTDAYFAELNRQPVYAKNIDFVNFSINPQVHAFDNPSLIETLDAQTAVLAKAKTLFPGKHISVSPVTLKPRFNPNAAADSSVICDTDDTIDARQGSLFVAGWTLGSIAALAKGGAQNITFYETYGAKGFFASLNQAEQEVAPFMPGYQFPMLLMFKLLSQFSGKVHCKEVVNDNPLDLSALVLCADNNKELIVLANHTDEVLSIGIKSDKSYSVKQLTAELLKQDNWFYEWNNQSISTTAATKNIVSVDLEPMAVAILAN